MVGVPFGSACSLCGTSVRGGGDEVGGGLGTEIWDGVLGLIFGARGGGWSIEECKNLWNVVMCVAMCAY